MTILFNLASAKAGGGQNVVLNFLGCYFSDLYQYRTHYYVVAEDSLIEKYVAQHIDKSHIIILPKKPIKRIFNELLIKKHLRDKNIDIIYSYFGYGLYPKYLPQVIGSATSNLFFPEVNFWSHYSGLKRLSKWIIDQYRIFGLKHAAGIIFETELQEQRCKSIYNIKAITETIRPSINLSIKTKDILLSNTIAPRRGLFLCGWQLNKNIMLIPQIAKSLKDQGFLFSFIITAPYDDSKECKRFYDLVSKNDVSEYIEHIGVVNKDSLKSLYSQVDIIFLLSKLESFSNNIIEAWTYDRILMISDEMWAHSICGEAAIYVERDDIQAISSSIIAVYSENNNYHRIVKEGKKMLCKYPTIQERTEQELDFIYKVYAKKHI